MLNNYFIVTRMNWQLCWQKKEFRYKFFICFFLLTILGIISPFYFQYVEKRNGIVLNDVVLQWIKPIDVSIPICILIWSTFAITLFTGIKSPNYLLKAVTGFGLLFIYRFTCLLFVPLDPPRGIIYLADPLSNFFYGIPFVTKDLFFSGHTATIFLFALFQHNKWLKNYLFVASGLVAILVLVQHIHYTIDVLFAFPFAYISYRNAKYFINIKP